jgi:hypothetical protein
VGAFSDFAEVDGLATFGKEEEAIETLEEHGGWLMNLTMLVWFTGLEKGAYSAENSLAVLGEFLHQIANRPGCLRVKTRGGFIQEEE